MLYQCRFISCNKGTILVQDVDGGGGYACVGMAGDRKWQYFVLSFAVNLKLL